MTTALHTIHALRLLCAGTLRALWFGRTVARAVPAATLGRMLVVSGVFFAAAYIVAGHVTLYEGGRFSELQADMRRQQLLRAENERVLTDLRSARAIRGAGGEGGLVDVSAIRYVESASVVADARMVGRAN
ncbi:MAG: hypothetical protein A2676_03995 [Candidatus Sungbacteria bacterium RIFCSPHIGHO2_01_FULL_51_22]|uniref:Uncharacterized protein n=1 Tax=Candidatus Sungbacteria bacterium RIFCSPHIGHO2_02_FULL_51_29 TaxID=1802273 RepID=A0A1G2KPP6_9BACT|nr:MAG: hypothetical protein A2676_03995 [Candidatus Sungbacteria bacterium RIFCSPHIGHO2_01_FULL_51_22]OHA01378.1 MAG: hypothetical protein A3C16_00940 [Candidatus Sungbacteria bacterium RIFCSPHIGHO2_02_FULL_51_29]OHA07933.1 MAG: hypothetical protein A3B29_01310 [Candidatus Sungbacteria bacterium RIFCSPLOWO2_01_FULL_51_34]